MTDPRFTESSCFGKHVRSVTHHIYSYQLYLGCCFCSASFGTKPTHNRTQQQQCQEHATTSIPIAPSSSRQRHARVTDTRAVLCRVVLSNPRSVTRHIYRISAGAIFCCSSYTCEVQAAVLLLLLYGLKSPRLCCLPWQQCGSRRLLREGSSTYAHYACLSST